MPISTPSTPRVPTPGLIASLSVRPWIDHTTDGTRFAPVLITHPPARRDADTAAAISQRMLSVARALGAKPPRATLPNVGARVAVHNRVVLVRLDDSEHMLMMRAGRWAQVIVELGQVLLTVGLDPLSPGACGADVDEYIECSRKADRLYFAIADVAESPRYMQATP
ncbi:hypothetical protein [Streptomyces sp. NBC_00120]|uniref:Uncharacterized protein n=1 Tax=Streptomyces sp. NBC_00119 TaxID=2975659 RepID=A0AAU1U3U5_9ACTN|nr:hypothetical protein [Streptomyces sp. NBC_00120]MCX5321836.1 hypothetical protein [Streptomyces sp. NBC_00120]